MIEMYQRKQINEQICLKLTFIPLHIVRVWKKNEKFTFTKKSREINSFVTWFHEIFNKKV